MTVDQEDLDAAAIDFEFEELVSRASADLSTTSCSGCRACKAAD
jgi:hypothetical protein